jgi:hypothetical protein
VKFGKYASETCAVLCEAYYEKTVKKPYVLKWHK